MKNTAGPSVGTLILPDLLSSSVVVNSCKFKLS